MTEAGENEQLRPGRLSQLREIGLVKLPEVAATVRFRLADFPVEMSMEEGEAPNDRLGTVPPHWLELKLTGPAM